MKNSTASYPHPVFGNSDDIAGADVRPELNLRISDEAVHLSFSNFRTQNQVIDKLVKEKQAQWVVRLQCARTYYRAAKTTSGESLDWTLDARALDGRCTIHLEVCAKEVIKGYHPDGLHPDYGQQRFTLSPGDKLALAGVYDIIVDKDFDDLRASVDSFVRVRKGEHERGPFSVDFEADLIEVILSKQDWDRYHAVKERAPGLLHATVVLPVLVDAIRSCRNEQYGGYRWSERLIVLTAPHSFGEEDILEFAQKLLGDPLSRGLDDFLRLTDSDGDEC